MARSRLGFFAAVLLALLTAAASPIPLPSSGNVNGIAGLLFWPSEMPRKGDTEPRVRPSAEGCTVHLIPVSDYERELTYPCGRWFAPSNDKYMLWLETEGAITPTQSVLVVTSPPFQGNGKAGIFPVAPAGRIAFARDAAAGESLRLMSTVPGESWIFDRRVHARSAQMPTGGVIAARFDRATNDCIAVSRPVESKPGATTMVWPEPPKASDLMVILDKPPTLQLVRNGTAALIANIGGKARPADVLVNGRNRIVAIWYALDAERATITLRSDTAHWPDTEARLQRGKVTMVRGDLRKLPAVHVSVLAPPDAVPLEELRVEIASGAGSALLRNEPLRDRERDFDGLPAEPVRVTLKIGEWKLQKSVDLSSGGDERVSFEIEPIEVRGTVYYGDDRAAAEIAFRNDDEWRIVRTDDRGDYRTTFWWGDVRTAKVTLAGRSIPAFLDAFREIFESATVDFHVPRTDYTVRVRDAATGAPIAGANVTAGNVATDSAQQVAQHVTTDDSGAAVLPPLRRGELIVGVTARGYARSEPLRVMIDDQHHELDIALRSLARGASLRVVRANGSAAAGAGIIAVDDAGNPLWRGSTDRDGIIEVPELAEGALVMVHHAGAASAIRRWSGDDAETTWTLEAPAEPLTVIADPRDRAKDASVAVWLDGVKLHGPLLAMATSSAPFVNAGGTWVAHNLPPRTLRVLAVARDAEGGVASSAFDALAVRVDYPWPPGVTMRVVH